MTIEMLWFGISIAILMFGKNYSSEPCLSEVMSLCIGGMGALMFGYSWLVMPIFDFFAANLPSGDMGLMRLSGFLLTLLTCCAMVVCVDELGGIISAFFKAKNQPTLVNS
jgi:hypothetical protein